MTSTTERTGRRIADDGERAGEPALAVSHLWKVFRPRAVRVLLAKRTIALGAAAAASQGGVL